MAKSPDKTNFVQNPHARCSLGTHGRTPRLSFCVEHFRTPEILIRPWTSFLSSSAQSTAKTRRKQFEKSRNCCGATKEHRLHRMQVSYLSWLLIWNLDHFSQGATAKERLLFLFLQNTAAQFSTETIRKFRLFINWTFWVQETECQWSPNTADKWRTLWDRTSKGEKPQITSSKERKTNGSELKAIPKPPVYFNLCFFFFWRKHIRKSIVVEEGRIHWRWCGSNGVVSPTVASSTAAAILYSRSFWQNCSFHLTAFINKRISVTKGLMYSMHKWNNRKRGSGSGCPNTEVATKTKSAMITKAAVAAFHTCCSSV